MSRRLTTLKLIPLVLATTQAFAAPLTPVAPDDGTTRPLIKLREVKVLGLQPTSLPTQIPTTMEGITGAEVVEKINATDSEDALKYFPSLLVRKRYIGDYDHAVLATRASGTSNSARSMVFADGILLSNLLGNGATFTPRWGLVAPEEIERVDVLYGPFSAAYAGNSVGAVVDYVTRMPKAFEARAQAGYYSQKFDLYGTHDTYSSWQSSASMGARNGAFSWWFNLNRLDSESQPLVFANRLRSAGTPGGSGTAVDGAFSGLNPREQPWLLLGATNQANTVQDHAKLKLSYDLDDEVRLNYVFGLWRNDVLRDSQSYLSDASDNPVYSGNVVIGGSRHALTPTDISLQRAELDHRMHGLTLRSNHGGSFDYSLSASRYDYHRDEVRSPSVARPAADHGGTGRIADGHGTGWNAVWLSGTWRSADGDGDHVVDFGAQRDDYQLRTAVLTTSDWIRGAPEARFSAFAGDAQLTSFYLQDSWRFAPRWRTTLGLRHESWRAENGRLSDATQTLRFPLRKEENLSPKAAIVYDLTDAWSLKASTGRAVRYPTVSELYQGSISTNVIVNNDPNLKPEKSWTQELSAERALERGSLRATLFFERTADALYSQTNVTVTPNVTNIQNVDRVRTRGVEFAYSASDVVWQGLDLSASVTFADSLITRNDKFPASIGKWQPRVPRWRANLLGTYRLGQWTATLGARYSGRQFGSLDNVDPNGDAYTGVSNFLVLDARLRYVHDAHWSGSIGVDNLNNREYWNFHPYPQRTYALEVRYDYD
ncbi:TonB-dependent receptor [Tahibacter caeni]|uniref:TonB-dependent receptor n=1 Tax=Tahibacter caeni TaxID=1453545 RepID=UPI0021494560